MSRLEVLDFASPTRWRWRLSDDAGVFLADHVVDVDRSASWQFDAFTDLDGYLKGHAAPDRRLASEAELVAQVGDWAAERLLGPVAVALVQQPGPVRLVFGGNGAPAGAAGDGAGGGARGWRSGRGSWPGWTVGRWLGSG